MTNVRQGSRQAGALPPAVVVGSDCVTGLQVARILAARGIPLYGLASDLRHFCCRTRVYDELVWADITGPPLLESLRELAARFDQKAVLVPCTDIAVLLISRGRDRLADCFHIALPDPDVVELLSDKARFSTYAEKHGLPVPRTLLLRGPESAAAAAAALRFPVVVKPPLKTPRWERDGRHKAYKLESPAELVAAYTELASSADELLAQEWIPGDEDDHFTCNAYFDRDARPVATFVTQKIRQWPPHTGQGSLAVEARNDVVLSETIRLFAGLDFWGLAYLEMKRDARTGQHYIVEPNVGRPTGRSSAAEASGVELLAAMYCDVVGLPLPDALTQKYVGTKWIYFGRDLRSALYYRRRHQLTIREWVRSLRGRKVDAVFSWRDPLPFLFDVSRLPALIGRRRPR